MSAVTLCGLPAGPESQSGSSPVHVVAEVRGIMSAQRAYCSLSLSLSLTHSSALLFTVCDVVEQLSRSGGSALFSHHCNVADPIDGKSSKTTVDDIGVL